MAGRPPDRIQILPTLGPPNTNDPNKARIPGLIDGAGDGVQTTVTNGGADRHAVAVGNTNGTIKADGASNGGTRRGQWS